MPYPIPPRSAYLHIPFCHRRCFYCDFAVVPLGDQARADQGPGSRSIREYLSLLHREIASAPVGPPLSTVYIGGGTPSLLCPDQIAALLDALAEKFGLQPGAEITLEMDPATFDCAQLSAVLSLGVNRISLGGQSFDDSVLEQLGRRHRQHDLQASIDWLVQARRDGVLQSWSLDLIQNLPGQTVAAWEEQLDQAIASQAPHLSIYDLSVEPGTVFDRQRTLGALKLPDDDLAVALMDLTTHRLAAAGLSRYEISNHARPGHASRHNRVYWSGAGWWGFGMGATSAPWGERLARPRTRAAYAAWLDSGPEENVAEVGLPLDDQLLVGLRRREGVTLHGFDADALVHRWQPFVERGWLQQRAGRWCLTDPEGMAVSNQVLIEVILWWEEVSERTAKAKSQSYPLS
uniref:radical SAM family heme chaperone HemW n=1 Tax=Synechococcus sp. UW106 TaxID=368495 RepID=UPI000E0F32D0|nr:radical SAM family heme chaperone HemW [Synechococcus sp. UW106]